MTVYELTHLFFRYGEEFVDSPKNLGLYDSCESVKQAIAYYSTQPGFRENTDAFSTRERMVLGNVADNTVFEAIVHIYTEDYAFETGIELGLFGEEATAQNKLAAYRANNLCLVNSLNFEVEMIVNRCIIGRREWPEGFSIDD